MCVPGPGFPASPWNHCLYFGILLLDKIFVEVKTGKIEKRGLLCHKLFTELSRSWTAPDAYTHSIHLLELVREYGLADFGNVTQQRDEWGKEG